MKEGCIPLDQLLNELDVDTLLILAEELAPSAGVVALLLVPGLIGFGVNGVVANSLAALIQSVIGDVSAQSLFAILQSIGTKLSTPAILGAGGGTAVLKQFIECYCSG